MVKYQNVDGHPKDLTIKALNKFQHKYGSTPDVVQLSTPVQDGNIKGYFAPSIPITRVGQRVEGDFFIPEFNEKVYDPNTDATQTVKIPSHGGGIAAYAAFTAMS